MSAFQDFGPLSERRRAEREQKRRKRIMMAGGTICSIIIIAAVAAVAVIYANKNTTTTTTTSKSNNDHKGSSSTPSSPSSSSRSSSLSMSTKLVQSICSQTDYKQTCVSTLTKATNSTSKPKDIIKAAVSVIYDRVDDAFGNSSLFKSDDPLTTGAIEVCHLLLNDSKSDLMDTIGKIEISRLDEIEKVGPVLNVWLSAVRSYQETCVDAFPEGEAKNKMKEAMKTVNQLTSNALAIFRKAGNFLEALNIPGIKRRLLSGTKEDSALDQEGFPSWIGEGDRRVLKQDSASELKPDVIVAMDGSGQFTTINDALKAMPANYDGRYVIYVKEGTYDEQVTITKAMKNITMYGDGSTKTTVTGSKNFKAGVPTYLTATFSVMGDGFMCIGMRFRNTAGPKGEQAVALLVQADGAIFLNCRMEGYQDTLYSQSKRQFYRGCFIMGTVDFIFGDASALFQNCILALRPPQAGQQNIITAQGRADKQEPTGFIIHNCRIIANDDFKPVQANFKNFLARPWKAYSMTVFMETEIGEFIDPAGYLPWGDTTVGQDTCFYAEYNNRGPGAKTDQRANWKGVKKNITKEAASQYTASAFIVDIARWTKNPGVPVPLRMGFFNE